jgi:hypothetical protein
MAETEKYPHVTFFFNGKKDEPFPHEDRTLVQSPKDVATYDLKPEMSAVELTEKALPAILSKQYDFILLNYANPASPPQDDLILMSRAVASFLLISKQASDRPLSANEEWSAALRGNRPGTEPWISNNSVALDSRNRLIDRWGVPLHFHALGGKQWEIRSAGPDKKMWSDDDLLEKTFG